MTPRTANLPWVFTSLTRRYSGLSGPLRPHTPRKSRNGYTNWRNFTPRLSLNMITSPHPEIILPASTMPPWKCISPQVYAVTGISPPQLSTDVSAVSSISEVSLTSHFLSHFLPVGLLCDTWTWREGTPPLVVPLESRIQACHPTRVLELLRSPDLPRQLEHHPLIPRLY